MKKEIINFILIFSLFITIVCCSSKSIEKNIKPMQQVAGKKVTSPFAGAKSKEKQIKQENPTEQHYNIAGNHEIRKSSRNKSGSPVKESHQMMAGFKTLSFNDIIWELVLTTGIIVGIIQIISYKR